MDNQIKQKVEEFVKIAEKEHLDIEAILLADKSGILVEHHFYFSRPRNIYSHSKSYTSLMAGIAIDEGKLSLDSHFVDILRDELTCEQYEKFYDITLKDLLTMRSGFCESFLMSDTLRTGVCGRDWMQFILSHDLKAAPGTTFVYSNGDTHLVSRMIQKVYGKTLNEICFEKIFKPLGMPYPVWENDPTGHTHGASNLFLDIKNMNMIGRLFINNGKWNDKQIISKKYIDECFTLQANANSELIPTKGYSFQFWVNNFSNSIRADGMYGQITIIDRDNGYTLSIQCPENGNLEKVIKSLLF